MKYLVFSDVELDTIIGSTAYISSLNGYGFNLILGWYSYFDDDWIWGTLGGGTPAGNCNGDDFSSDGSDEIQFRLNNPEVQTIGADGYTDYVTVEINDVDLWEEDRIYLRWSGNLNDCLEISELNHYLTEAHSIIYEYDDVNTSYIEGVRPTDKNFISIEIIDDVIVSNSNYLHTYRITYAKPYYASTN